MHVLKDRKWRISYGEADASDEQLMAEVQNGSAGSFEELYHRYSKRLLVYFYRMLGSEEKAQDFLQDIFLKIIEHPQTFHTNRPFSNWIFSVAANMCKNEYRHQEVRRNFDQNAGAKDEMIQTNPESGIAAGIDHSQFSNRLAREIRHMDADHRNTFLLRFQENFSIKEISQILNCPEGTVKSRLFYTTQKLAARLKDFDPSRQVESSTSTEVKQHEKQK